MNFSAFCKIPKFLTVFKRVNNWFLFCYIKIRFSFIFFSTSKFFWFILPFRFPDQNVACISHLCCMPLKSHPSWFYQSQIWQSIQQTMELLTLQFFPSFIIISILRRKIIPNICSAKFYNPLRYPNISDTTASSKSIVCILQLCFIKIYLFYCRIILLFCRYRKL